MFEHGIIYKLERKWRGLFEVELIRNEGAYRLKNQLAGKIISRPADKIKPAVQCDDFLWETVCAMTI